MVYFLDKLKIKSSMMNEMKMQFEKELHAKY